MAVPRRSLARGKNLGCAGARLGSARALLSAILLLSLATMDPMRAASAPALDPSARMLESDQASEYWTLFVELDSGHRISQRFLITNAGPGSHNAVAVGHLMEPGRPPYRYVNGRTRSAWTLSPDRLFLDIAASHLDLHRPTGALKITKDDVEIRLGFDLADADMAGRVSAAALPPGLAVEALAVGAATSGQLRAPWMMEPIDVTGRTWLVHTWTSEEEAGLFVRRVDVFGRNGETSFYGIQLSGAQAPQKGAWQILGRSDSSVGGSSELDSRINFEGEWKAGAELVSGRSGESYPVPGLFVLSAPGGSGEIRLASPWLRFDPFEVIPQPFRWFIRRTSQPQEVWADARIAVSIGPALTNPSLPPSGQAERVSNSRRETEDETADRRLTGVASVTFLNPIDRR